MSIPNQEAIEKLRALQKYILDEPRRFNLNHWGGYIDPQLKITEGVEEDIKCNLDSDLITVIQLQHPPCGTVACLAGNVCVMAGLIKPKEFGGGKEIFEFPVHTPHMAKEYLGIPYEDGANLFYLQGWNREDGRGWPVEFETLLKKTIPGTKEYAEVAAARIEHYILTGE